MIAPAPMGAAVSRRRLALFAMLGFSAGLPFYMFSTVLALRLQAHGVALVVIGFFAWVQLLPTLKFLWAPLLDRYDVPGFARFWGKRRGWILLSQLGICAAMVAMALTAGDGRLGLTALFAVLLAFWTTTLEIAADAWRIELAPTQEQQGPIVAANIWGYRSAMVAAGSGALLVADGAGWAAAYLAVAAAAFLPFPMLVATAPDRANAAGRTSALLLGLAAAAAIIGAVAAVVAVVGWAVLAVAAGIGLDGRANVTPYVLVLSMLPFVAMALALPRIRRARPQSRLRQSAVVGPYVDFFWRYGFGAIVLMGFIALYRMGDVLALNLSKPMVRDLGYSLGAIGRADGLVALAASMAGVGFGGLLVMRWRIMPTLATGGLFAAAGNFGFVWLAGQPLDETRLYIATGLDQFGNGMAGANFVVYLSMLVNPRFPGAQYAFLSGWAFMLPRLLSGAGGTIVETIGYDSFFLLSGVLSLAALLFLPLLARITPRRSDLPE